MNKEANDTPELTPEEGVENVTEFPTAQPEVVENDPPPSWMPEGPVFPQGREDVLKDYGKSSEAKVALVQDLLDLLMHRVANNAFLMTEISELLVDNVLNICLNERAGFDGLQYSKMINTSSSQRISGCLTAFAKKYEEDVKEWDTKEKMYQQTMSKVIAGRAKFQSILDAQKESCKEGPDAAE